MAQENLKLNTYEISGDNTILDEQNSITPEVRTALEDLQPAGLKGNKFLIKKLHKLCLKYPEVPVFKNILSTIHQQNGDISQAFSVNHWLVKEHPNYLFGKLNLAAELLLENEPEKVTGILGEALEISELYPDRKEFHIEEVLGFNHIAIQYFLALNEIEQAESRLQIMEDLDADHHKTQYAREYLQDWYITEVSERLEEEELLKKNVVIKTNRSRLQTKKAPEFNFPEQMDWLYQNDLGIDHDKIQQILQLDSHKLIEDLEKMLQDSISRFDHFSEKTHKEGHLNNVLDFPIHALLLLSELKSEKSLGLILQLLKQDEDFNVLWFGGLINEVMDNALYHCGKHQTSDIFEFLRLPNIFDINKAVAGEALVKIIANSTEEREVFVEQYRRVLNVFIENATDENYLDTDSIGFIISDITDLAYKELLPEIKQLFDLDLVGFWICGIYDEVKTEISKQPIEPDLEFINQDIFEKYDELSRYEDEASETEMDDQYINELYNEEILDRALNDDLFDEPIQKPKKIGRNDPCPCGSGKKYKKCCINQ